MNTYNFSNEKNKTIDFISKQLTKKNLSNWKIMNMSADNNGSSKGKD